MVKVKLTFLCLFVVSGLVWSMAYSSVSSESLDNYELSGSLETTWLSHSELEAIPKILKHFHKTGGKQFFSKKLSLMAVRRDKGKNVLLYFFRVEDADDLNVVYVIRENTSTIIKSFFLYDR